jgi:lipopolysaccharide biosynthesis protein
MHYLETLPKLLTALNACCTGLQGMRLWISTDRSAKADAITAALQQHPIAEQATTIAVRVCPNRGRNLGPLLLHLWPELQQEALVLHLHGKRSKETDLGDAWLDQLLKHLLPDGETVLALRQQFQNDPHLGVVMPQPPDLIRPYLNWGMNFELASQLARGMGLRLHRDAVLAFPAGGMFWARPAALAPLTKGLRIMETLPPEPLAVDGSSLHAIERLVAHACESSGHHWRLACNAHPAATAGGSSLSVLTSQPDDYQQATSLLALHYRLLAEELLCSETNLESCGQQISSASQQLLEADSTIKELVQRLEKRDQQIQIMASSWGWKLMRLWQRL